MNRKSTLQFKHLNQIIPLKKIKFLFPFIFYAIPFSFPFIYFEQKSLVT